MSSAPPLEHHSPLQFLPGDAVAFFCLHDKPPGMSAYGRLKTFTSTRRPTPSVSRLLLEYKGDSEDPTEFSAYSAGPLKQYRCGSTQMLPGPIQTSLEPLAAQPHPVDAYTQSRSGKIRWCLENGALAGREEDNVLHGRDQYDLDILQSTPPFRCLRLGSLGHAVRTVSTLCCPEI
ncbi:hypothetical protein CVT26_007903 [Gymnopilus dilepis]|uniref:Uncharacterized protein n=1 Tax=Gymnopilus dilepis TaxID=231916 RepID=A0A409YK82_9AGAR|nr:hypothetical protein CVT26_007903 [Gymnopilus dilepis]